VTTTRTPASRIRSMPAQRHPTEDTGVVESVGLVVSGWEWAAVGAGFLLDVWTWSAFRR